MSMMAVLRHGGMGRLFTGVRAPPTLGTFLRAFRFGHVRQLDAVASRFLTGLTRQAPLVGTGADVTFVNIDDTLTSFQNIETRGQRRLRSLVARSADPRGTNRCPTTVPARFRAPG
jgi:hypothetical protein